MTTTTTETNTSNPGFLHTTASDAEIAAVYMGCLTQR